MTEQQTIFITGCSSGIGRSAALLFAERGWQVTATMRNPADGAELAAHPGIRLAALDVTDEASVRDAIAGALVAHGHIDVLVNNAGFGAFGPFETASQDLIDRQLATNINGVFAVTRAVLPAMRARRSGTIINISSIGGLTTFPMNAIYHATKYAVAGFTEALSHELHPFGIKARVVAPGGVATDFSGRSLALTFDTPDNPYNAQVEAVAAAFRAPERAVNRSTPEMVAETIFNAATDPAERVLYVSGKDAEMLLAARAGMAWADYAAMTRRMMGV